MIPSPIIANRTYDVIEVEGDIPAAYEWCVKTFGPPGNRWFYTFHKFYFSQEKDYILFELRW